MHEISWHHSGSGGNWFECLGFSFRFEREKRLALWKAGFFYRTFNPWVDGSSPSGPTLVNKYGQQSRHWARFLSEVQLEIFLSPLSLKIRGGRLSAIVLFVGHPSDYKH